MSEPTTPPAPRTSRLASLFNGAARGAMVAGQWTGQALSRLFATKVAKRLGVGGALLVATAWSSIVMVNDDERAQIGGVHLGTSARQVEPGHVGFKLPFLESATIFRTSGARLVLDDARALTADNQVVRFVLAAEYDVPGDKVPGLAARAPDFSERLDALLRARLQSLVGALNAADVPARHGELKAGLEAAVAADLERLYGVKLAGLEIPAIEPETGYLARLKDWALGREGRPGERQLPKFDPGALAPGA